MLLLVRWPGGSVSLWSWEITEIVIADNICAKVMETSALGAEDLSCTGKQLRNEAW